jgi:hypothetical protein
MCCARLAADAGVPLYIICVLALEAKLRRLRGEG